MASSVERAILSTVSYFDLFSYPLTAMEIWKWLIVEEGERALTLADVSVALQENPFLRERLTEAEGFFFLRGRDTLVTLRKERYLLAERKYQRLTLVMQLFRFLPFLRLVAVCNNLAYSNASHQSDLDLLVVVAPGHIWTARMFATGLARLLRIRPGDYGVTDPICLSFYVASDAPSLHALTLSQDDIYFRYWLDQLTPIYGDEALLQKLQVTNAWYRDRVPNAYGARGSWRRNVVDSHLSKGIKRLLESIHGGRLGKKLEHVYQRWQEQHLPEKLQRLANIDSRVVMNRHMLKFHENDRRKDFIQGHALRLDEAMRT